ncbi:hypothetical protein [Desulfoscipio gibsoniae]|uniref:IS66 family transposase n=1 Tax=Desulfoscipio gibsoniae TaxID=102134 RepID=UPI000A0023F8|nr:hypothetical protein [Desulfoscipio gibsoniae]
MLGQQNVELTAKLRWFEEQFRLSQQRRFGASSKRSDSKQFELNFFNEAEVEAKPEAKEPTVKTITYQRRKKRGHRESMLENLPV